VSECEAEKDAVRTESEGGPALRSLLALSAAGGALMYLSFPPVDLWWLAWAALAPLLMATALAPGRKAAALCGIVFGLAAYLPALFWLTSVSVGGWVGLVIYLSVYAMLSALIAHRLRGRHGWAWPLLFACAWAGLELVRTWFCTGFPWLLFGYTQYRLLALVQLAAVAGVYAVSFLLVLHNACLAEVLLRLLRGAAAQAGGLKASLRVYAASVAAVAAAMLLGLHAVNRVELRRGPVVGVIQQNIPRLVSDITAKRSEKELYARAQTR
jgi:apolipoprotein N-acyltransferase